MLPLDSSLFESLVHGPQKSGALARVIKENLELAARDMTPSVLTPAPSPPATLIHGPVPPPTDDVPASHLLNDVGEYLMRTAELWARLTEHLTKGPHLEPAVSEVVLASKIISGMAETQAVVGFDMDFTRLRKIRELTAQFSRDVQNVWRSEPNAAVNIGGTLTTLSAEIEPLSPPSSTTMATSPAASKVPSAGEDFTPFKGRQVLPDPTKPEAGSPPTDEKSAALAAALAMDDSDDDDTKFLNIDMAMLEKRGKGSYRCPKAFRCDKGGVDKDGKIVMFDRNSAFIQHCNKHRKPWKCEKAGCPNPPKKRKFARRDGLMRHIQTVKHYPPT
ncbi:hypothetical protein B0I35DRAFT_219240 [Stachybotrys elegans]|uniref:Uncharacterized protein n=1 Tax=Stachybotrys elegans TaxID=80388 RepID=A0A8K0WSX5_9HYPO|nr:hypothetical protein B0I35DRAFT_219240 [Stachybotrys elegans]